MYKHLGESTKHTLFIYRRDLRGVNAAAAKYAQKLLSPQQHHCYDHGHGSAKATATATAHPRPQATSHGHDSATATATTNDHGWTTATATAADQINNQSNYG
jgi:hypothetical protein